MTVASVLPFAVNLTASGSSIRTNCSDVMFVDDVTMLRDVIGCYGSSSSNNDTTGYGEYVANDSAAQNATSETGSATMSATTVVYIVVTCAVLSAMILATIIGNVLVIAAIVIEKNLQSVANYLIASLAVADLLVAVLVMPMAAVKEVSSQWFLGKEICDMWISFDVLCCTSSILHLVAISVDRYWAVTRADYIHNRPVRMIVLMIGLSWGISAVISIPPLFGWKDPENNPEETGQCVISQDWGYTVYSTVGAFYIPLIIMIIIYLNVYRAARLRIRKRHFRSSAKSGGGGMDAKSSCSDIIKRRFKFASGVSVPVQSPSTPSSLLSAGMSPANGTSTPPIASGGCPTSASVTTSLMSPTSCYEIADNGGSSNSRHLPQWTPESNPASPVLESSFRSKERKAREKREQMRERKAARTLAIITGSFVGCWLPFFILALVGPFCGKSCQIPDLLVSVIGWLGYFNSLLNPVIYTVFSLDFRSAFQKILFGRCRRNRHAYSNNLGKASTVATNTRLN